VTGRRKRPNAAEPAAEIQLHCGFVWRGLEATEPAVFTPSRLLSKTGSRSVYAYRIEQCQRSAGPEALDEPQRKEAIKDDC
jgi:hypothetical protein